MKVTQRTYDATVSAWHKWDDIFQGIGVDDGETNCALCQLFEDCFDCPISIVTGNGNCIGTPYASWFNVAESQSDIWSEGLYAVTPEAFFAAAEMRDFIGNLLKTMTVEGDEV